MGKASKNVLIVVVSQPATFFVRRVLCHPGIFPFSQVASSGVVNGFIEAGYCRPGGGPEEDLEPEDPEPEDLEEFKKVMRWRSRVARRTFVGCTLDDRDIQLQLRQNPTVPAPAPILDAQSPAPH